MDHDDECSVDIGDFAAAHGGRMRSAFKVFLAHETAAEMAAIGAFLFDGAAAIVFEYRGDIEISAIVRYAAHISVALSDMCQSDEGHRYGRDPRDCAAAADRAAMRILYDHGKCETPCSAPCALSDNPWGTVPRHLQARRPRSCIVSYEHQVMMRGDVEHIAQLSPRWGYDEKSYIIAIQAFREWAVNGWIDLCEKVMSKMRRLPYDAQNEIVRSIIHAAADVQPRLIALLPRIVILRIRNLGTPIVRGDAKHLPENGTMRFLVAFAAKARRSVISDIHCVMFTTPGPRRDEIVDALIAAEAALPGPWWPVTQCTYCRAHLSAIGRYGVAATGAPGP